MATFELAIEVVLANEGGCADHADDPGGETCFGLQRRQYPGEPWPPTRERAIALYRLDHWDGRGYHLIREQAVATKIFDMAVNLGSRTAIRLLQRALNYLVRTPNEVLVDGILGPYTLKVTNQLDPDLLVLALRAYHVSKYIELVEGPDPRFESFSQGWLIRAMAG